MKRKTIKITFNADEDTVAALEKARTNTIDSEDRSFLINMMITCYMHEHPNFCCKKIRDGYMDVIHRQCHENGFELQDFLEKYEIERSAFYQFCKRASEGLEIRGSGNNHPKGKYRDKHIDRIYHTRTAYWVDLCRQELGWDMEKWDRV